MVATISTGIAGCHDDEVTHHRVSKESADTPSPRMNAPVMNAPTPTPTPTPMPMPMPSAPTNPNVGADAMPSAPPRMEGDVPTPPKPSGGDAVAWTLPQGWTQNFTGGIRYATLVPSGPPGIDASVVVLPGPAGGELANVNRWRGQIGLAPLDQAGLPGVRKMVETQVGPVSLFDFSSEGERKTRLVAGLVVINGNSWFFKMAGESTLVGNALPAFTQLIGSLRPNAHPN